MKHTLCALAAGLSLALTVGAGSALAGNPVGSLVQSVTQSQSGDNSVSQDANASSDDGGSQSVDQSQSGSNTIDQTAKADAKSANVSPNVAVGNGHGDQSQCGCGSDGNEDGTTQSSSSDASANAGNRNDSWQSNDQSQQAGQTQTGSPDDSSPQTIDQSESGSNTIDQTAKANAKSLNLAPNLAFANEGDTSQSSSSNASANAGNSNDSTQANDQWQKANQHGNDCRPSHCQSRCRPCYSSCCRD